MKLVNTDKIYRIYDGGVKICDSLPVGTYVLSFEKLTGFYLEVITNIEVKEKIYGPHPGKVEKVLRTFKNSDRNLGVILSGDKGIGKSVCAKLIAQKGIEKGYPVIVIKQYIPGISDYLSKIDQEVIILFDEFDKVFKSTDEFEPQDEMLTLFDGVCIGKRLFVITCNEIYKLNDYLVNRPGRFHYHFRFSYPTPEEITEYMQDKIDKNDYNQIADIIAFSSKVNLNYDCLRAIATEINHGYTFKESLEDLNIVNIEPERYDITVMFTGGETDTYKGLEVDLFNPDTKSIWVGYKGCDILTEFTPTDAEPEDYGVSIIPGDKVKFSWEDDDDKKKYKNVSIERLILRKRESRNIHYLV